MVAVRANGVGFGQMFFPTASVNNKENLMKKITTMLIVGIMASCLAFAGTLSVQADQTGMLALTMTAVSPPTAMTAVTVTSGASLVGMMQASGEMDTTKSLTSGTFAVEANKGAYAPEIAVAGNLQKTKATGYDFAKIIRS